MQVTASQDQTVSKFRLNDVVTVILVNDVVSVNTYSLIHIGLWLRHLQNASSLKLKSIRTGVTEIIDDLEAFRFNVSRTGAYKLEEYIGTLSSVPDDEVTGAARAKMLANQVRTLEKIIFAESLTKHYYITTERRYNTVYLLEEPTKLFMDGVFDRMPQLSQHDFQEGFKCLVFERPTAAAFHILRATEGILKDCYMLTIKRNRLKNPMWGNMLEHLKQVKKNKWPQTLLEALDNIRRSYRNPTNHPEAIFTIDEAEDLMGLCLDVANKLDKVRKTHAAH